MKPIVVDNSVSNSDWIKHGKYGFDFPFVETVEDFEREFRVPADEPARGRRLEELAKLPWVDVAPEPIRDLLLGVRKASFGGDRSAAGRYAAEQRWKGHVKKQPVSPSNPYNLQVSENLGAQLSLIGAAMRTVEDAGVETQVFGRSDLTPDDINSLGKEIDAMRRRIEGAHNLNDFRLSKGKISEDEYLRTNELLRRADEAVRLGKMALTKMSRDPDDEDFEDELLVSRDADGKLAGLSMISTLKKDVDLRMLYHNGPPVVLTVKGKSVYVEFLVSFQSVPQMGRALFGELLKKMMEITLTLEIAGK